MTDDVEKRRLVTENSILRSRIEARTISEGDIEPLAKKVAAYLANDHGIAGVAAHVGSIIAAAVSETWKGNLIPPAGIRTEDGRATWERMKTISAHSAGENRVDAEILEKLKALAEVHRHFYRLDVLEEAARAVCSDCAEGRSVKAYVPQNAREFVLSGPAGLIAGELFHPNRQQGPCRAGSIRLLQLEEWR